MSSALTYLTSISPITILVLGVLTLYLFCAIWLFSYRYLKLSQTIKKESDALRTTLSKKSFPTDSIFGDIHCKKDPHSLQMVLALSEQESTEGLTFLSIASSTAPFIGLFGTVVSILESFAKIGSNGSSSLASVAPIISEALVATAAGILVAIFAYTFHLILKRLAFKLHHYLTIHYHYLTSHHVE